MEKTKRKQIKKKPKQDEYPRIKSLGLKISPKPIPHVKWAVLSSALEKHGLQDQFSKYFRTQTCSGSGPYLHDVEAILEKIL